MIIYNVTINVDNSIRIQWLHWIKEHIPLVLATGKFKKAKLTKILVNEDPNTTTYAVQYTAKSPKHLKDYYKNHAEQLRKDSLAEFANKTFAFRTELEVIDEFVI